MLSNIASYLLGYAEPTVPAPIEESLRLTTVETEEDDWLIVERPEDAATTEGKGSDVVDEAISSDQRRGSLPSCLSLEESWFITPPPCFASTGPVRVETSPLENLLIEHPSMSVYTTTMGRGGGGLQGAPAPVTPQNEVEEMEEDETSALPPRSRSLSPLPNPIAPATHHFHQTHLRQHILGLHIITAQKHQNFKTSHGLKRNQLEKGNKVREVNNRNKRQCRKDRQKNPSGANNNRKCC